MCSWFRVSFRRDANGRHHIGFFSQKMRIHTGMRMVPEYTEEVRTVLGIDGSLLGDFDGPSTLLLHFSSLAANRGWSAVGAISNRHCASVFDSEELRNLLCAAMHSRIRTAMAYDRDERIFLPLMFIEGPGRCRARDKQPASSWCGQEYQTRGTTRMPRSRS